VAALTKGLAAENSSNTQPTALESAVFLYGFGRVMGTTWCETAMLAKPRAQNELICTNNGKKNLTHGRGFNDLLGL